MLSQKGLEVDKSGGESESSQPGKPRSESGKKEHILAQGFSMSTCFLILDYNLIQQWHPNIRFVVAIW